MDDTSLNKNCIQFILHIKQFNPLLTKTIMSDIEKSNQTLGLKKGALYDLLIQPYCTHPFHTKNTPFIDDLIQTKLFYIIENSIDNNTGVLFINYLKDASNTIFDIILTFTPTTTPDDEIIQKSFDN